MLLSDVYLGGWVGGWVGGWSSFFTLTLLFLSMS